MKKDRIIKKTIIAVLLVLIFVAGLMCGMGIYVRFAVPADIVKALDAEEYDRACSDYDKYYGNTDRSVSPLEKEMLSYLQELTKAYADGTVEAATVTVCIDAVAKMSRLHIEDELAQLQTMIAENEKTDNEASVQNEEENKDFVKQFNAALDAYGAYLYTIDEEHELIRSNGVTLNYKTACADVTGDGIPELILHEKSLGTKIIYTFDESTGQMTEILNYDSGKGYAMPVYYNIDKMQYIFTAADTGGGRYIVYELAGKQVKEVRKLERFNSKFTKSVEAEWYVDGELVSEEIYDSELELLLADYVEVNASPVDTLVMLEIMRKEQY